MKIKKVLGEGSYGSVVVCEKDGKDYALKTVKGDCYGLVSVQEVDIMNSVFNPFLCSASKTYIDGVSTLIFMDLASETLHKHKFTSESELKMIAFQMVCSLAFLEKRNIVHGDIKGNNFLCFKDAYGLDLNVRLTDFSLSCRSYGRGSSPLFKMFCSIYRPLEAWFGEAGCKSDVWALGCCLYEFLTGDSQLFPSQDEKYDGNAFDLTDGCKVHRRWRSSNDAYVSILGQFADKTNQPLSDLYQKRIEAANSRIKGIKRPLNIFVRDWMKLYRSLPSYIRDMLTVDPAKRPSADDLFHAEYFKKEREALTIKLTEYYDLKNIPHSEGPLVLLDGAIRHHLSRNSLEYEEIRYFLSKPAYYERVTKVAAMDIFSRCKHVGDSVYILQACLLISLKITDPSNLEWFEYDRQTEMETHDLGEGDVDDDLDGILEAEKLICQALNYVLYPESSELFDLTDEQLYAFFL